MPRLRLRFLAPVLAAMAFTGLIPCGPAAAQDTGSGGGGIGSVAYRFLQAVRTADGDAVTSFLNQPGNVTLVNTRDQRSGETALLIVVRRSDATYLRFLLSRGADPNLRDDRGNSPLLLAVTQGDTGMATLLIDGRANVNLANQSGETPLIRAVQARDITMVRLLLTHGADPDQRDVIAGQSARDYATADPRARLIADAIAEVPPAQRRTVAGPTLR